MSPDPERIGTLCKSPHLEVRATGVGAKLAYHRLFGNLAWLDDELHDFLTSTDGPTSYDRLSRDVGPGAAQVLYDSYFYVDSEGEERTLIEDWLAEREGRIHTGYYLGGLQISSSNACNFACSYCFADASDRRSPVRQAIASGPANISFDLARAAIHQVRDVARRHGRDRIAAKFLGREPLINWKVIRRLLDSFDDSEVAWSITTNGSLITPEIAAILKSHRVQITVSLDGLPEVNDRLRVLKHPGSRPPYEAAEAALECLATTGHAFAVSSVISRATDFASMYPFIDRIAAIGAREIELTLAMQTSDMHAQGRFQSAEELAIELADLYDHATARGLIVHGDWVDPYHRILTTHKFRDERLVARPLGVGCVATEHQISLEPSGDLFPCRSMSLHYGNVADLATALAGDAYRRVAMRTFFNVPYCRGCQLEGHCQGTCLGSSEESSGDIYHPQESYCAVYRAAAETLLNRLGRRQSETKPTHAR